MGMREKIAWKHVVNQKGNLYLMDEAEKTYIVDFGKLNPKQAAALHQMHVFYMVGLYAFPLGLIVLTLPYNLDLLSKLTLMVLAIGVIYLLCFLMMIFRVIPQNIREILEEKKR